LFAGIAGARIEGAGKAALSCWLAVIERLVITPSSSSNRFAQTRGAGPNGVGTHYSREALDTGQQTGNPRDVFPVFVGQA